MTVLEEYIFKVDDLRARLDNVSSVDCTNEVLGLIEESSNKLAEMIEIIANVSVANGTMAASLRIMKGE